MAAVPITALVYYLGWVTPTLVPVPSTVEVPFPALTKSLEPVCRWSGQHRQEIVLLAGISFSVGFLFRFKSTSERYYTRLALVSFATLVTFFLSISAPIDRLLEKVDESLPEDHRIELRLPPD